MEKSKSSEFNILIADHIQKNIDDIINALKIEEKYHFETADSGESLIETVKKDNDFDLLIIENDLPSISGIELCKKLKKIKETSDIPVIIITSRERDDQIIDGLDSGVEDFITRPLHNGILRARVRSALRMKNMYDSIKENNEKLSELNEFKDNVLSMVSHDIRNNLTGIIGHCYIVLMEKAGSLSSTYKNSLKIILKRSRNISALVNNIIQAARIKAGKFSLNLKETDMEQYINQYFNEIKSLHGYEKLNFLLNYDDKTPKSYMDPEKIDEVFTNLVNNAVKFTPKGGEIEIGVKPWKNNFILCYVRDTGKGIPEEDIPNLFIKFYKKDNISFKKTKSSGLGLSICKSIIEAHSGEIWAESTPDQGSIFKFTLPALSLYNSLLR